MRTHGITRVLIIRSCDMSQNSKTRLIGICNYIYMHTSLEQIKICVQRHIIIDPREFTTDEDLNEPEPLTFYYNVKQVSWEPLG